MTFFFFFLSLNTQGKKPHWESAGKRNSRIRPSETTDTGTNQTQNIKLVWLTCSKIWKEIESIAKEKRDYHNWPDLIKDQIEILEMKNVITKIRILMTGLKQKLDELKYWKDYAYSSSRGEKTNGKYENV